jgi:hypothetical protein
VKYFEAPDGHGESTIWEGVRYSSAVIPNAVIRQRDVPEKYWLDVVARMTGTTTAEQAWDEGYTAGYDEANERNTGPMVVGVNPYRRAT